MGAAGHGAWLVLAEPGLAVLTVASALGRVAVEVPQIQFIDAVVLEQFQLDKFLVGPLLCNDSSVARGCSTLTMSMYLCDAVAGLLHGALLRNACSTADTCSATALGALVVLFFFLREGVLGS